VLFHINMVKKCL